MTITSNEAAFGRRRQGQILLRKIRLGSVEGMRWLMRMSPPSGYSSVGIWPEVSGAKLADVLCRVAWYVPDDVAVVAGRELSSAAPSWWGGEGPDLSHRLVDGDPLQADLILLADVGRVRWFRRALDRRVMVVDPGWYGGEEVESFGKVSSLNTTPEEWEAIDTTSRNVLESVRERAGDRGHVAVFGTGPSMTSVDPESLDADVVVACNSAVSNKDWIRQAKPAVIAFADAVFHFGPSRYAAQFREDLRWVAEETDAVFIVPRRFAPLAVRRIPFVADRLVAVGTSKTVGLDAVADDLVVPKTSNVLTRLMLPVAAALGRHVSIAGCDGRRPDERYFWEHSRSAQYGDDLMNSAFEAHPSFFRDRDYQSYYDRHSARLEQLLSEAEQGGMTFASVTHSEIPALKSRAVS